MNHTISTDYPINDLLRERCSPYAFDPNRVVSEADLSHCMRLLFAVGSD